MINFFENNIQFLWHEASQTDQPNLCYLWWERSNFHLYVFWRSETWWTFHSDAQGNRPTVFTWLLQCLQTNILALCRQEVCVWGIYRALHILHCATPKCEKSKVGKSRNTPREIPTAIEISSTCSRGFGGNDLNLLHKQPRSGGVSDLLTLLSRLPICYISASLSSPISSETSSVVAASTHKLLLLLSASPNLRNSQVVVNFFFVLSEKSVCPLFVGSFSPSGQNHFQISCLTAAVGHTSKDFPDWNLFPLWLRVLLHTEKSAFVLASQDKAEAIWVQFPVWRSLSSFSTTETETGTALGKNDRHLSNAGFATQWIMRRTSCSGSRPTITYSTPMPGLCKVIHPRLRDTQQESSALSISKTSTCAGVLSSLCKKSW